MNRAGPLPLEDMEAWLQRRGLPAAGASDHDDDIGVDRGQNNDPVVQQQQQQWSWDQRESYVRVQQAWQFQHHIHAKIFADVDAAEQHSQELRLRQLQKWQDAVVTLEIIIQHQQQQEEQGSEAEMEAARIRNLPIRPLAESCETIYVLAESWNRFQHLNDRRPVDKRADMNDCEEPNTVITLSLHDYSVAAVKAFVDLVFESVLLSDLPDEIIVDCCYLAHYLQNERLLAATTEIMVRHISTENCLAACQLADRLQLTTLWERAMGHLVRTMSSLSEDADPETWNLLSPELQGRIQMIQSVLVNNSMHHSQPKQLYFGSVQEYMAIFAERIEYYQERLDEAKRALCQLQSEQEEEVTHAGRASRRNLWRSGRHHHDAYVQEKIAMQEERLQTLKMKYQEQKKLFLGQAAPDVGMSS